MSPRPNIILCTCDQLRAFEMGCYGNPLIRTPHLDLLAAEGARFDLAITNYPVCMAARSILLSGQYNRTCTGGVSNVSSPPGRHGEIYLPQYPYQGRPHIKERCLPELLQEHGYRTAAIGKWHIHSWPQDIGFDHYLIPRVHHCHAGQSFTENGGPEFVPDGYSVDFEMDRVESFLRQRRDSAQPFFLFYNISPPHCPLADAPDKYLSMYRPEDIPIRPNVDLHAPIPNQDHHFKVYRWDFRYYNLRLPYTWELPPGYGLRHVIAEYYGLTTWVDDTVGRMLTTLEQSGLAEDTIVIFTSDHGDNLGSHGLVQKGSPNEEAIRIPLLVRWPGAIPAGQVIRERVAGLADLAPTLLDLAGVGIPAHMHGQSLGAPLMGEGGAPVEPHAFFETPKGTGIRTPQFTYFLPWGERERVLGQSPSWFYDDVADPYQLHPLGQVQGIELDARLREWDRTTPWMVV
jgi:arylsulfatase A-like enzyme